MSKHFPYKVIDSFAEVKLEFNVQHASTAGTDLILAGVHLEKFEHDFSTIVGSNKALQYKMLDITTTIWKVAGGTQLMSGKFRIWGGSEELEIPFSDDSEDDIIIMQYTIIFY